MLLWRGKYLFLLGAAGLAFAIPAAGQRDRDRGPESLLPPGLGDPRETPPTPPESPPADNAATPAPQPAPVPGAPRPAPVPDELPVEDASVEDLEALAELDIPPPIEVPAGSRRPTNPVGALRPADGGLGLNAFGNANGRFLSGLMGRLDAPLPSRWASILLRRALLSEVAAPSHVNEVDWVAERAWLLLRMGEADAARMLVQAVDVDRFTPRLFTVAVQVALATADPAALCPLVPEGRKTSDEPVWPLADAMCAALEGEASRASQLIDQARRRSGAGGIDVLLAEKVIGAGLNTRRAVTVQWDGVDEINSWRFGLASATGLEIPAGLMEGAGPAVWAWLARAPMVPVEQRVAAAWRAADLGVFSSAALVELHSLVTDTLDVSEVEGSLGARLRNAYVAGSVGDRMSALRSIWDEGGDRDRYARLILTAGAAARIPAHEDRSERADDLVASIMGAGLDGAASLWGAVADSTGEGADRAWSILAVGTARPVVDLGRAADFANRAGDHRGEMLLAALAGLGRLDDPASYGVEPTPRGRWANLIDAAARADQPGTVALLAAVGMQTGTWRGVPPGHLYRIVRALRQVGLDYEARMIAAEAMTRL